MSTAATRAPALTSANAGGHGHVIPHIVVNTVIVFNLAVAVCSEIDRPHEELWAVVESACLVFFGLEMLVKLACQRRGFWRDRWNLFDLTVIALAALPLLVAGADLGVLRVARVARVFHLGRHVSNLRLLARWRAALHWLHGLRFLPQR